MPSETQPKAYLVVNGGVSSIPIMEGDTIVDFRGERWEFISVMPDGRSYKIYARKADKPGSHRIFFASVFGLVIK